MKNKSTKYITLVIAFILLSICSVYLSVMLHKILSKELLWFKVDSFSATLEIALHNKGANTLFLGFEALIILVLVATQITRLSMYKSELVKVTDDIYIPQAVGENQYGSARFYAEKELKNVFTELTISKNDEKIEYLMKHGCDDLEQ